MKEEYNTNYENIIEIIKKLYNKNNKEEIIQTGTYNLNCKIDYKLLLDKLIKI